MTDKADIIKSICESMISDDLSVASEIARRQYPFYTPVLVERKYTEAVALRVFMRDGFVDRYSGGKLLFPPVLRVLSIALPSEFPFHRNWKMSETHPSYWELFPTLDHVVPIARGGADTDDNLVSTSMLHNSAKAHWTLEELNWTLHPPGDLSHWDGLLSWFLDFIKKNDQITKDKYVGRWFNVANCEISKDIERRI